MALPFRNNPKISTNWFREKKAKPIDYDKIKKTKRAYYGISVEDKILKIHFREEKKTNISGNLENGMLVGWLEFELDSKFAKDLKMFLEEYVKNAPKAKR